MLITLAQLSQGYRYNSDSLLLSDFILKQGVKGDVLDVGAGCGIIGILLKIHAKHLNLSLLDIQEENIYLIKKNLKANHIQAHVFHVDFNQFQSQNQFDFIVCNPPFYTQASYKSPNVHKYISKFEKFLPLHVFFNKAHAILKPHGSLYFCYEASALDKVFFALKDMRMKATKLCFVHTHENKPARLVLIQVKKGVKSPCEILTPFFVYENEILSKQMQEIHLKFRLESYDI
ncbi:methyltransferase [Campylobacter sp. VicNov18]|uniref:tRNA1(Val) (adenine(37)-N6)-methyltransferase n=1 Tax=Campylobacter bilis TaxID=2691918 RepID=UPI00130E4406|nr:methyltransferase [Campylobacter bilis]MPV64028.1 methyltransferase [Campylobacter hepaticus]MBM0637530.1 methyltransferase [Campylobacter bilis]MCC8278252.1 methyltransferase [Campylobacter bilis]MCC8299756.1 methyltransferase [Campylobacter bilis]MCC8301161.1 methyltransferase [Campylobacter bilis]